MIRWSEEQNALRAGISPWLNLLSADHAARDADSTFGWDKWKLVRESGLLGLPFEARWGGQGQDLLTTMYVLEGLGYGCRDGGLSFSAVTHMVSTGIPLQRFGSAELRRCYLPGICSGERIGAHAITEPGAGSDALSMQTYATRHGSHFVLDGSKAFVTNAPVADLFMVYARTSRDDGPLGITAFLVERDTPGLFIGELIPKMGLRTSPLAEIALDGCKVPCSRVVGQVGAGFLVLDYVMKWEILCSFIINVGEMQHRVERCTEHARKRIQFGAAIGSFQSVANRIVEMKIGTETARKWLYDTAARFAAGENVTTDIAISKLLASESNVASALAAVQIFGAAGYLTEHGIEKDLRSAVAGTIYSGTSEIQRNRIASMLGL